MADTFVHFEIPADDVDAVMAFYESVYGWTYQRVPMPAMPGGEYVLAITKEAGAPGMDGGIFKKSGPQDRPYSYIGVESIDETLAKVEAAGGSVVQAKMAVPGVGWAAIAADPEGNPHGLFQDDSQAA